MQEQENKMFYRAKELAKYLGMAESTVWKKCKEDPEFPRPIKLSENMTVFNIAEVNEYMALKPRSIKEDETH